MPPKTRNQATAEETKASGEDGKRLAEASEKKGKKRKVSKKNLEQQSKKQKQEEEAAKKKQEEAAAKKAQESNSTVPMSDVDDDEEMNRAAEESLKTAAAETGPRLNREELEEKKRIDKVVSEAEKKQWDASDWERFRTDLFRLLRL
jgi:translation initiation factor 4G